MSCVTSACRLAVGASAALAVAAAPAQAARTIERGDHGDAVRALQRALGQPPDGAFGPGTKRAVAASSAATGSPPTASSARRPGGDPRRAQAPSHAGRTAHRARRPARRAPRPRRARAAAQARPRRRRRVRPADGARGQALPGRHGLTADGVVGPATWSALGVGGTPPVLKRRAPAHAPRQPAWAARLRAPSRRPTASPRCRTSTAAATAASRHRLRLLGLGLLRAARRRAARARRGLRRSFMSLRRPRPRPAHHDLRQPRPRLHGHRRAPLRHDRPRREPARAGSPTCARRAGYTARHPPATDARPRGPRRPRSGPARRSSSASLARSSG